MIWCNLGDNASKICWQTSFSPLSYNYLFQWYNNYPSEEGFEVFGIVKLDREPENITINLKSPVYISEKSKNGFQKIVDVDSYPINYKLFKKE